MRFRRQPILPFSELAQSVRTGDLLLARGSSRTGRFIEFVTDSAWSHSGMIVRPSDVGIALDGDPPLLWESTTCSVVPCVVSGKNLPGTPPRSGPMLVPLAERIETDATHFDIFAVRHLYMERTPKRLEALREVVHDVRVLDSCFPAKWTMYWEVVKERFLQPSDPAPENAFYCSHLLSHTLQRMGLLPEWPVPESYMPADYSKQGYVPWLDRAYPGPEIYIKHFRPRKDPAVPMVPAPSGPSVVNERADAACREAHGPRVDPASSHLP